jgi:hypothetical protein
MYKIYNLRFILFKKLMLFPSLAVTRPKAPEFCTPCDNPLNMVTVSTNGG